MANGYLRGTGVRTIIQRCGALLLAAALSLAAGQPLPDSLQVSGSSGGGAGPLAISVWAQGDGILYTSPNYTKVGIGTSSPAAPLDVAYTISSPTIKVARASGQSSVKAASGALCLDAASTSDGVFLGNFVAGNVYLASATGSGKVLVGGGTSPSEKLHVVGNVKCDTVKASVVKVNNWTIEAPDYVFGADYSLPSLGKVEKFISDNKHLPEVPSATEMKAKGVDLAVMNMALLKKAEELTLYAIQQEKRMARLEEQVRQVKTVQ
jgi:hypothetical protein